MSAIIRATSMTHAFINATAQCANSKDKMPWMAKRVMENCDRERVGLVKELNEINIAGTPPAIVDKKLRHNLPGLCGEL